MMQLDKVSGQERKHANMTHKRNPEGRDKERDVMVNNGW